MEIDHFSKHMQILTAVKCSFQSYPRQRFQRITTAEGLLH